jgi:hypothetical protein
VPQANAKLIPTLVQTVIDAEQQLAIKVNIYFFKSLKCFIQPGHTWHEELLAFIIRYPQEGVDYFVSDTTAPKVAYQKLFVVSGLMICRTYVNCVCSGC